MIPIIGHSQQIDTLKKQAVSGRLPGAYLFAGPNAIGKKLVARLLSRHLACTSCDETILGGCGNCQGCRKVEAENHPDRFFVEADGDWIKIDQIRELQSALHFHPLESTRKIAIIDDAHRMNASAANSMLKILEEPPTDTHFILISHAAHLLPPTIRSRCQKLFFPPLREDEIAGALISQGTTAREAKRIARLAGGSMGTAISLDSEFVDDVIGRFIALFNKAASADIIERSGSWAGEEPARVRLILDILGSWYRDILRYQVTENKDDLIHQEIGRFASNGNIPISERGIEEIEKARRSLDINANKQLMFENLLFTLTSNI